VSANGYAVTCKQKASTKTRKAKDSDKLKICFTGGKEGIRKDGKHVSAASTEHTGSSTPGRMAL
jgi:hypothetical protein